MTPSRFTALVTLEIAGPMTQGELARREQVAQPTMSRTVASLEAIGYVHRSVPPTNRRCVILTLTPAGAAYLEAFRQRRDAYLATRLSSLSGEELAVLEQAMPLLQRLLT